MNRGRPLVILVMVFIFGLPLVTSAAEFATHPLFLSRSPVSVGQKVRIFAIISDTTGDAFGGQVTFEQDGNTVGTTTATLAAGASQTVSTFWTPTTGGDHVVTAKLVATDGTLLQKVSETFTVTAPPPVASSPSGTTPGSEADAGYQSSTGAATTINKALPIAAPVTSALLNGSDFLREGVSSALSSALGYTKGKSATATSTTKAKQTATAKMAAASSSGVFSIFSIILIVCRYIVDKPLLFYPLLLFVLYYVVRKFII